MKYDGIEIIGEVRNWNLTVDYTLAGVPAPSMSFEYRSAKTLSYGKKAREQIGKLHRVPLHKRDKYRTYARCRIDFYIVEED